MKVLEVFGESPSKKDKAVALELQQELVDYGYDVDLTTAYRDGYPGVRLMISKQLGPKVRRDLTLNVFNELIYMPGVQGNFDSVENAIQNLKTYFAVSGKEL